MSVVFRACRLWYTPRWLKWLNLLAACVFLAFHFAGVWASVAWGSLSRRSWYLNIGTPELVQQGNDEYGLVVVPPIVPAVALIAPTLWLFVRDKRFQPRDHQCSLCGRDSGPRRTCLRCARIQVLLVALAFLAGLALLPMHLIDRFLWLRPRILEDEPFRVFVDGAPRHEGIRDPVCSWLPWSVKEWVGDTTDDAGNTVPWFVTTAVGVPLWPLGLAVVTPSGFILWRALRRVRPGHCGCGYNLTGNVSGRCPECGQGVAFGEQSEA